jgi:pentatricopeptide repeat protein
MAGFIFFELIFHLDILDHTGHGRSPQLRQEGLVPSVYTFSSLINVHVRSGDLSGALKVRKAMRKKGVRPNVGSLVEVMWDFMQQPLGDEFDHL